MATKNSWFTMVKKMMKSSLGPNVIFGSLLACMEKLMEEDFECPCDPELNVLLVTGYFLVPAVFIFVVMSVQGCKNKKCSKDWTNYVFIGFAQAMLWLILLFMDGNYLACAKTDTSGAYVKAHEDAPWKWCKPENSTELVKTKKSFVQSKFIGLGLILFLSLVTAPYMCCCSTEEEQRREEGNEDEAISMGPINYQSQGRAETGSRSGTQRV